MGEIISLPFTAANHIGRLDMEALAKEKTVQDALVPIAAYYLALKGEGLGSLEFYQLDYFEIAGVRFAVYGSDCKAAYDVLSPHMSDEDILSNAVQLRGDD